VHDHIAADAGERWWNRGGFVIETFEADTLVWSPILTGPYSRSFQRITGRSGARGEFALMHAGHPADACLMAFGSFVSQGEGRRRASRDQTRRPGEIYLLHPTKGNQGRIISEINRKVDTGEFPGVLLSYLAEPGAIWRVA